MLVIYYANNLRELLRYKTNSMKARVYRICTFAFPTISVITIIVDANPSITVCAGNNIYRLDNNSIYHQRRIPPGTGGAARSTLHVPVNHRETADSIARYRSSPFHTSVLYANTLRQTRYVEFVRWLINAVSHELST